jgi:hypothetical protein
MHKVFAISYDLKTPGRNYGPLFEAIKKSPKWWHYLDSMWLVYTTETPKQIWDRLSGCLDKNDVMLIIEVRNNSYGFLPKAAWEWISQHATPS